MGGGYTGLSAALELARAGVAAAVIEARDFGQGASTRNGGHVSGGINLSKGLTARRGRYRAGGEDPDLSTRATAALLTDAAASFDCLEAIIAREQIHCCYERSGRFVGAYAARHYDTFARRVEILNRHTNAGASLVPRERQREEIASDFYYGGIAVRRSGKLHPGLYYKGLLDACRRSGITLCARAFVRTLRRRSGGFILDTDRGTVEAEYLIIATNGETGGATPALKRRVIPVASHIIATEELSPDLARSLLPTRKTISDTPRLLTYYRMSPDGRRVLFGGRARFTQVPPEVSVPVLYRFMTDRLPQLRGVKITHAWTGNVAFTFDSLPHMGQHEGIYYALGCNGSGVAMMTYLGIQTARKIVGQAETVCAFDAGHLPGARWYTGEPWFLPLLWRYYRARDVIDRRLG